MKTRPFRSEPSQHARSLSLPKAAKKAGKKTQRSLCRGARNLLKAGAQARGEERGAQVFSTLRLTKGSFVFRCGL